MYKEFNPAFLRMERANGIHEEIATVISRQMKMRIANDLLIQPTLSFADLQNTVLAIARDEENIRSHLPIASQSQPFPDNVDGWVRNAITKAPHDLTFLAEMHKRSLYGKLLLGLFQGMVEIVSSENWQRKKDMDSLYKLADTKRGNPDYVIQPEHYGDICLIAFLPRPARMAVIELIVRESNARFVENHGNNTYGESTTEHNFFQALAAYQRGTLNIKQLRTIYKTVSVNPESLFSSNGNYSFLKVRDHMSQLLSNADKRLDTLTWGNEAIFHDASQFMILPARYEFEKNF